MLGFPGISKLGTESAEEEEGIERVTLLEKWEVGKKEKS